MAHQPIAECMVGVPMRVNEGAHVPGRKAGRVEIGVKHPSREMLVAHGVDEERLLMIGDQA